MRWLGRVQCLIGWHRWYIVPEPDPTIMDDEGYKPIWGCERKKCWAWRW